MGLVGVVFSIASVVGPLLGGVFTTSVTWRWCFYINLPIGSVTVASTLFFFRTPAHAKVMYNTPLKEILRNFDLSGLVLLLSSLLCYFLALQWAGISRAWNSSTVIGLIVGWILLTAAFAVNEWKQGEKALVVFRILRNRSTAAICATILL